MKGYQLADYIMLVQVGLLVIIYLEFILHVVYILPQFSLIEICLIANGSFFSLINQMLLLAHECRVSNNPYNQAQWAIGTTAYRVIS